MPSGYATRPPVRSESSPVAGRDAQEPPRFSRCVGILTAGQDGYSSASAEAARQQSWYDEYSGTGASRITSGSRESAITPYESRNRRDNSPARSGTRRDS